MPPHVLMELSKKELKRLKDNSLHLDGLSICLSSKNLIWNTVTYGKNIKMKKTSSCSTPDERYDELNYSRMNRMIVTASKKDCMSYMPNLIISSSTHNTEPSGVLVLLASTWKPIMKSTKCWNVEDLKRIKKCKPNILNSNNHHKSSGYYASFGNKGSFEKTNDVDSSVGQYVTKKNTSLAKQIIINNDATLYEKLTADEISRCVNDFKTFIPNIKSIIAPVLDVSYDLQSLGKDLNIKEGYASKDGCWQTSLCADAITGEYHNEQDCTYTLITIPQQEGIDLNKTSDVYNFLFHLTGRKYMNIPLYPGISLLFSGAFLTHRQHRIENKPLKNQPFFNIASYGNKRLFNHIKKSFNKTK